MLTGLFTTTSALQAIQSALDTTANNLANLGTNAFKGSRTQFQDLPLSGLTGAQVGHGVRVGNVARDFSQGQSASTGNDLDVAVQGEGFFAIRLPDGSTQYTRDGSFHLNSASQLVASDGNLVQPTITFPADTTSIKIDRQGAVSVLTSSSPDTPIVLGQLRLTRFINPEGLKAVGSNRFSETTDSGIPITNSPGLDGLGVIEQGSLEQSNVEASTEFVHLTTTNQNYVANSCAVKVEDQILQSALDLVG